LGLEDLLDNLLFFDQESADNTVSDTVGTTRTTIGTADVLVGLGDSGELTRTESLNTSEGLTTVTTTRSLNRLLLVLVDELST
jgi:hypothetical protein